MEMTSFGDIYITLCQAITWTAFERPIPKESFIKEIGFSDENNKKIETAWQKLFSAGAAGQIVLWGEKGKVTERPVTKHPHEKIPQGFFATKHLDVWLLYDAIFYASKNEDDLINWDNNDYLNVRMLKKDFEKLVAKEFADKKKKPATKTERVAVWAEKQEKNPKSADKETINNIRISLGLRETESLDSKTVRAGLELARKRRETGK